MCIHTELFEWNVTEVAEGWQRKFQLLCAFQRDKGHCRVPKNLVVDSVKLGQWVSSQRQYYKKRMEEKTGANTAITEEAVCCSAQYKWI